MPENRTQTPFLEQLKARKEFKPGDVIPVTSMEDFDTFATYMSEELRVKHGRERYAFIEPEKVTISPYVERLKDNFIYGENPKDVKFNGRFENPRIIITEPLPLEDRSMTGRISNPHLPNDGIVEQFTFILAMDMHTTRGGYYRIPAQLACDLIIVDHGIRTISAGENDYTFHLITKDLSIRPYQLKEAKNAIKKNERVSMQNAEEVERFRLRQGPLPGSFGTGKRR